MFCRFGFAATSVSATGGWDIVRGVGWYCGGRVKMLSCCPWLQHIKGWDERYFMRKRFVVLTFTMELPLLTSVLDG